MCCLLLIDSMTNYNIGNLLFIFSGSVITYKSDSNEKNFLYGKKAYFLLYCHFQTYRSTKLHLTACSTNPWNVPLRASETEEDLTTITTTNNIVITSTAYLFFHPDSVIQHIQGCLQNVLRCCLTTLTASQEQYRCKNIFMTCNKVWDKAGVLDGAFSSTGYKQ